MKRILSLFILSVLMVLGSLIPVRAEENSFDAFLEEEFRKYMSAEYLDFHFGVRDYKSYGLEKPEVAMPSYSYEEFAAGAARAQASLDSLHQFDYAALNDIQQHDYLVYESYLKDMIGIYSYPDFNECYNPYKGDYSNLITIMTEFIPYNREDAEDYLTLTAGFAGVLSEMDEFTRQQAAKGFFMSDASLDVQLKSMQDFVAKGEENPFIIIYGKNIDQLEELSAEEKEDFKKRNRDLVLNSVYPAIENSMKVLESLRGSRSVSGSVYEYENGPAYYEALAVQKCSDDNTLTEKRDYLAKCMKDLMNYVALHIGSISNTITEFSTPEEVLSFLGSHMEGFPAGPELKYTPSYLDPSVAVPSIMAYYMQTPIDNVTDNVIRINGGAVKDDMNTLYYTLAHEGLPGHMYQFTWFYSQNPNPIRYAVNCIGYTEGWAQYVERIMLLRSPLSEKDSEFLACNVYIGYILQAYADILVNGFGYNSAQLGAAIDSCGLTLEERELATIYEAVSSSPGQILPYGYGLCKMWEFNERVHKTLGNSFDLEEFHRQILTYGHRPFDLVESDLKKYTEGKGFELVSDFTLFEASATENFAGRIIKFISDHFVVIMIAAAAVLLLVLWLLFLLIRGIWRLITGKKPKKKKRRNEEQTEAEEMHDE